MLPVSSVWCHFEMTGVMGFNQRLRWQRAKDAPDCPVAM